MTGTREYNQILSHQSIIWCFLGKHQNLVWPRLSIGCSLSCDIERSWSHWWNVLWNAIRLNQMTSNGWMKWIGKIHGWNGTPLLYTFSVTFAALIILWCSHQFCCSAVDVDVKMMPVPHPSSERRHNFIQTSCCHNSLRRGFPLQHVITLVSWSVMPFFHVSLN